MSHLSESSTLEAIVQAWLQWDQNERSVAEVSDLWRRGQTAELERLMRCALLSAGELRSVRPEHDVSPRLEFGTAGLRGTMHAGFAGMNDLMVVQTCQGIARYVKRTLDDASKRGIVVGHDHRHNSERWSIMAANVFRDAGFVVHVLEGNSFTPLCVNLAAEDAPSQLTSSRVPFGVTYLKAAAGCMITASHNPAQDNGIKIYWENGVQIISPHDIGIASAIEEDLRPSTWNFANPQSVNDVTPLIRLAYFSQVITGFTRPNSAQVKPIRVVHTSLHGVGEVYMREAIEQLSGAVEVHSVVEQMTPDPDFPTTAFPNPEEKGTLDLAMALADKLEIKVVVANDPDADRFAAAEKDNDTWRVLTGNELGIVLASAMLERARAAGTANIAMITTVVSSKMLQAMAAKEDIAYGECLTGFKNLGNLALSLESAGANVVFSYEEALGYAVSPIIKDKDGISALVVFLQLLVRLQNDGRSLMDHIRGLQDRYGHFESRNDSVRCEPSLIGNIFHKIRGEEKGSSHGPPTLVRYPRRLAGLEVTRIIDVTLGFDSAAVVGVSSLGSNPGQMVQLFAEDNSGTKLYATVRASGTEPKVKYYLEAIGQDAGQTLIEVENDLLKTWLTI